jgi:hypothetical protein
VPEHLIAFEDNGVESSIDVSFPFTQDVEIAQELAQIELKKNRLGLRCVVNCQLQAMQLITGDTVRIISDRYKWFEDVPATSESFDGIEDDFQTVSSIAHGLSEGDPIRVTLVSPIAPLATNTRYFVRNPTANTFQFSLSRSGEIITLANDGASGSWFLLRGKVFEVETVSISNDIPPGVTLELTETSPAVYDPDTPIIPTDHPQVNMPRAGDIETPQNVTVASGSDELYLKKDGTVVSRAMVSWDLSTDPFVLSGGFIEVQAKRSSETFWTSVANAIGASTNVLIWDVDDTVIGFQAISGRAFVTVDRPIEDGTKIRVFPDSDIPSPLEEDTDYYIFQEPPDPPENPPTGEYYFTTDPEGTSVVDIGTSGTGFGFIYVGYDFRVRFANSLGVRSGWVSVLDHRVIGKNQDPNPPAGIAATDNLTGRIVVTWTDPTDLDLASVEVYRDAVKVASVPRGTQRYIDIDVQGAGVALTTRLEYAYTLIAVDTSGNRSTETSAVNGKMANVTPPAIADITQDSGTISVVLTAPAGNSWQQIIVYASTDGPTTGYDPIGSVSPGTWPGLAVQAGPYPPSETVYVRAFTVDTTGRRGTAVQDDITITS